MEVGFPVTLAYDDSLIPNSSYSSAHIQIFIRDQNDNFPEFSRSIYNANVLENSEQGTMIAQVQAVDVDSGDFGTTGIRYTNLRGGIAHL